MVKIYTRSGDTGNSHIIGGRKIKKSENIFELLGDLDELNAHIGNAKNCRDKHVYEFLTEVQSQLLFIGSIIAKNSISVQELKLINKYVLDLETEIDTYQIKLPKLVNFILPSGAEKSVNMHISRSVCRRAERSLVRYVFEEKATNLDVIIGYLNRLSDLLFVYARYINNKLGIADEVWQSELENF